jgi:hypothetical protein
MPRRFSFVKLTDKELDRLQRQAEAAGPAKEFLDRASRICGACGQGTSIFQERKNQIIREAIQWFESPSAAADSHVAVRYIAALAELVRLQDALEYRVSKGEEAKLKLYGDQTAGA